MRPDAITTTIIIPTRNRGRMACRAVASITNDRPVGTAVVVSDNSSNAGDRQVLRDFCADQDPDVVRYIQPPTAMSMSDHWEWARRTATGSSPATHVAYLTDRMIFKPGHLQEILDCGARFPTDVITYNYDMIEDSAVPIRLELQPWSGWLVAVESAHALAQSARCVYSNALPRMLNSLVPQRVLDAVVARFGSVFASIAPDVCFAYRCLAVVDRFLYYDKAPLLQYGIGRSQGYSYTRGRPSPEVADFAQLLGGTTPNFADAPIPELKTTTNNTVHEYCFVRGEARSAKFPAVDRWAYLGAASWDGRVIRDPARAKEIREILRSQGWTSRDSALWFARKAVQDAWHNPRHAVQTLAEPLRRRRTFTNLEEAIAWAVEHPRRRTPSLAHQWQFRPKPVADPLDGGNGGVRALMPQ